MAECTFSLAGMRPILTRTPEVLRVMLTDLSEDWTGAREGPSTWSAFDIVGHLIHGERTDWVPRARMILSDATEPFPAFDRDAQYCEAGDVPEELISRPVNPVAREDSPPLPAHHRGAVVIEPAGQRRRQLQEDGAPR